MRNFSDIIIVLVAFIIAVSGLLIYESIPTDRIITGFEFKEGMFFFGDQMTGETYTMTMSELKELAADGRVTEYHQLRDGYRIDVDEDTYVMVYNLDLDLSNV